MSCFFQITYLETKLKSISRQVARVWQWKFTEESRTPAMWQQWQPLSGERLLCELTASSSSMFCSPVGITLLTTHCGKGVHHLITLSHGTWPSSPCCWWWVGSRQCSVWSRWWTGSLEPSAGTANAAAVAGWAADGSPLLFCVLMR